VEDDENGQLVMGINNHGLSLEEFGRMLTTQAGWGMRAMPPATAATNHHSFRPLRDFGVADQLQRVHPAIHHKPRFSGGLGHQFFATGCHRWGERGYQHHVRQTAVLPVEPVVG
jgi:hypothetical protein